jgi:serine/threonine-protein kinase RsbW
MLNTMPDTCEFAGTYPGTLCEVRHARHAVAEMLAGCPRADDAELVLSEFAANAVLHSRSGQDGGEFTVRAELHAGDFIWLEVEDAGGPWRVPAPDDRPHGLDLVSVLADEWGIDAMSGGGRVCWCRLDLNGRQ